MRRTFIIIIISKFTAVNGNYHGNGKIFQKKIISLFVVLSKKTNQAFKQVWYAMIWFDMQELCFILFYEPREGIK